MFCPKCGKHLNDNTKFCTDCGYQIKGVQLEKTAQTQAKSQPEFPAYTEPVIPEIPPVPMMDHAASQAAPNHKKRNIVIALAAAAVMIALVCAGIKIFVSDQETEKNTLGVSRSDTAQPELPVDNDDEAERAKAYSEVISSLQQNYGVGSYTQDGEPSGLVVVREIDFDKDGTPELLCAFKNTVPDGGGWTFESPYCDGTQCNMCYEVWGWKNDQAVQLTHTPIFEGLAVDEAEINLLMLDSGVYMLQSDGHAYTGVRIASTVQNSKWEEIVHLYCNNYSGADIDTSGAFTYYNLGNEIIEEEYTAIQDKWFSFEEGRVETIPMWYGNGQFQQTCATIQNLNNSISAESFPVDSDRESKSTAQAETQINPADYIGEWYVQNLNGVVFFIEEKGGTYYISGSAAYQNGNRLVHIDPVPLSIYANAASAVYDEDSRGNHGRIQLEFQKDVIYATVTAVAGEWSDGWSMQMDKELCTRTAPYYEETADEDTSSASTDDYCYDSQYIDPDSLPKVTRDDIVWARNEIYARHGYIFQRKDIQEAFEAMEWYEPNPNYSDDLLNDIERENLETLISYERQMGWRE